MIPDKLIPLVYLVLIAGIAAGLKFVDVDNTTVGLIIGAGLTRVKMPSPAGEAK
jgi:hypothetical protein